MVDFKQTEFNMSLETLKRINNLINQAHTASRNLFPRLDNDFFYIETLDRIYVEAQTKFSNGEIEAAEDFQKRIANIRIEWGKDIYKPLIDGYSVKRNPRYLIARQELKAAAREYELFLMRSMSNHNMLLKDQESVDKYL